jgi:hypothetical protein
MSTSPQPLVLALHPILPLRTPEDGACTLTYGYQLRLPDGPALAADDPLLRAFGAFVTGLGVAGDHDEPGQHETFAAGAPVRLVVEGADDDGDPVVGVWDAERVRRSGYLPHRRAAVVAAALEQGLAMEALVLTEERALADDRRVGLGLIVHAPALLRVDRDAAGPGDLMVSLRRRARERVVLVADGSGELRWWDPSGRAGPMELSDLPVSGELAAELERLSAEYVAAQTGRDPMDALAEHWTVSALESRTRDLWRRARAELGPSYAVGLQGPGMSRPAWSPAEIAGDAEPDVDF